MVNTMEFHVGEGTAARASGDSSGARPVMRTLSSQSARARSSSYDASDDGASRQRVCDGKYLPETPLERRVEHEARERGARLSAPG